jgi:hypothetical protein
VAFIRKVKTASGATAVQIARKEHGRIVRIEHTGSTHTENELDTLLAVARERLRGPQPSLFPEIVSSLKISLREPVSHSFRMSKSDLRARPIFHRKRESIEAHLTIVFAVLAIEKLIESRTGTSIKRFVNTVRPIRSGVVTINGIEYPTEAEISAHVKRLLSKLHAGH